MTDQNSFGDELKVSGKQIVDTAKQAVHAGNVRWLVVRNSRGETLASVSLTVSLVVAVVLPWLVVVGIIALLVTNASITIERTPLA